MFNQGEHAATSALYAMGGGQARGGEGAGQVGCRYVVRSINC